MSAPLVVNTADGACWTRRAVTEGGVALYALADVCSCPEFVMATFEELAARGIVGSAFALPMPGGPEPEPKPRTMLDHGRDALRARMTKDDLRLVLENVITYAAALETERHSTNESLSEAAEQLRRDRDRIAELEAAPTTVYRAGLAGDTLTLGWYDNEAAARKHCETYAAREFAPGAYLFFDWIEDEDDEGGVAELTICVNGGPEQPGGYTVTKLTPASEYDEGADE